MTQTFQGLDGELRLIEQGAGAVTHYLEVLFCEMDFSGPIARPRKEETLIMDRGTFDSNAHYVDGPDDPRYEPQSISWSCRLADTTNTRMLLEWLSGTTGISATSGETTIVSTKGNTTIDGNTLPSFGDTAKVAYHVEIKWDSSSATDVGVQYNEVYFPPGEQSLSEAGDNLTLSCNGQVYGDISTVTGFTSGYTALT